MRIWIEKEWLPYALSIGVDIGSFWHLTPHTLSLIAEGYNEGLKRQMVYDNAMAHIQGLYFTEALLSTVGNMFSGKTAKKHNYPDKPYELGLESKSKSEQETEKERQINLFAGQLTTAFSNFMLSKEKGKV